MEELLKLLDEELEYVRHEISGEEIHINVKSKKAKAVCPYCGKPSTGVHPRVLCLGPPASLPGYRIPACRYIF